jgi:4-amino-4-deoxy-L-arabinose transferase-like glycosyltransferase
MQRAASLTLKALLVLLFGVAVWFRVTSIESLPDIESDEAWYGVQAYHLGRGEPFETKTINGNPLNPLNTGLEVPLLLIFEPACWILRVPSMLAGLLTIALTYVLGSRIFGRRAALIAAGLVAVLPITILYSRKGYDCSPTPLMSFLLLYFAYKESWKGMLLSAIGCFLSHPTTIFLFPIVATVYFVRAFLRLSGDPRRQWFLVLRTAGCGLLVLACGLVVLLRPRTQLLISVFHYGGLSRSLFLNQGGGLAGTELGAFLSLFGKLFMGCGSFGLPPGPWHDGSFWAVFASAVVPGTVLLVRDRRWDLLSLFAGLFLGAAGLFLVVGASALRLDANRYGLFLVMPTVLVFAIAVDRLIVAPTTRPRAAALAVQCAVLLAMGGALLAEFKVLCFDANRGVSREERIWTLRNDAKDAKMRAMHLIEKDRELAAVQRARGGQAPAVAGPGKTIVFVQDWWTWWTMEYPALPYKDVEVRSYYDYYQSDYNRFWSDLGKAMDEGRGYAVCFKGQEIERLMRSGVPQGKLKDWELVRYGNAPSPITFSQSVLVFRWRRPGDHPVAIPLGPAPVTAARPVERR